jgi:hypothetical protein
MDESGTDIYPAVRTNVNTYLDSYSDILIFFSNTDIKTDTLYRYQIRMYCSYPADIG